MLDLSRTHVRTRARTHEHTHARTYTLKRHDNRRRLEQHKLIDTNVTKSICSSTVTISYHAAACYNEVINKERIRSLRPRYQEGARALVATTTMTTPSEITAKFVEASNAFIVIKGHPTDSDVHRVFEDLSRILYPIGYDETDAVHNLIGIIQYDEPYKTKHGSSLPRPKRPEIFDGTIYGLLTETIATRKKEAAHA